MNHLHHKTTKIAISDHIEICHNCMLNIIELNSFKVLRICDSEHATKAQEALLKKKKNSQPNRQLYTYDSSFLLNHY